MALATVIYKVSRNGTARKTEVRITGDYQHITWKASLMSSKKQSDCVGKREYFVYVDNEC